MMRVSQAERECAESPRRTRSAVMTPKSETSMFAPQDFLAKVGVGKTVVEFQKNQKVFSQGDVACFTFRTERSS